MIFLISATVTSQQIHPCDGEKGIFVVFLLENHSRVPVPYNILITLDSINSGIFLKHPVLHIKKVKVFQKFGEIYKFEIFLPLQLD